MILYEVKISRHRSFDIKIGILMRKKNKRQAKLKKKQNERGMVKKEKKQRDNKNFNK